jgi:hypothetical protein
MPGGEPDKDECPVDARPGERPSQEGLGRYASEAGTAKRRRQGERANMRAGVAYTTLSPLPSAMWARLQGWRTTAGMQKLEQRREQLPR